MTAARVQIGEDFAFRLDGVIAPAHPPGVLNEGSHVTLPTLQRCRFIRDTKVRRCISCASCRRRR